MRYLVLEVAGDEMLEQALKEHAALGWTLHTLTYIGFTLGEKTGPRWHVVMERGI